MALTTSTTKMKRLKSGFLLKEILDRFNNKSLSTLSPNSSLYIYSAHDITLAAMLNSLGVFDVILQHMLDINFMQSWLKLCFNYFSFIHHRIHPAFSSSYTSHVTISMFNFSTEIQQRKTHCHYISQIVAQNVLFINFMNCTVRFYLRTMKPNVDYRIYNHFWTKAMH